MVPHHVDIQAVFDLNDSGIFWERMHFLEFSNELLQLIEGQIFKIVVLSVDALELAEKEKEEIKKCINELILLYIDIEDILLEVSFLALHGLHLFLVSLFDVVC